MRFRRGIGEPSMAASRTPKRAGAFRPPRPLRSSAVHGLGARNRRPVDSHLRWCAPRMWYRRQRSAWKLLRLSLLSYARQVAGSRAPHRDETRRGPRARESSSRKRRGALYPTRFAQHGRHQQTFAEPAIRPNEIGDDAIAADTIEAPMIQQVR